MPGGLPDFCPTVAVPRRKIIFEGEPGDELLG